jgi:hypothetical protein
MDQLKAFRVPACLVARLATEQRYGATE